MTDDLRDELPADLDPSAFVGPYQFPDNSRRRWPGVMYLAIAAVCVGVYVGFEDAAIVNTGWLVAAAVLAAVGVFSITSGWRMHVDETEALAAAQQALGFPVGHASAQQVWRGVRSRPTWRVLCYSAEDPPAQRGLVLVDAIDGRIIEHLRENNPEVHDPDLNIPDLNIPDLNIPDLDNADLDSAELEDADLDNPDVGVESR